MKSRLGFWTSVPTVSRIYFFAGVFTMFASVGFISLLMQTVQLSRMQVFITVLVMGTFAIGYAAVSIIRKHWLIPIMVVIEALFFGALKNHYRNSERLVEHARSYEGQLAYLGLGAIVSVAAGYFLFIAFFRQQGARYFRAQNEIAMASEIHKALVPPIQKTLGAFEVFGTSVPSGEVGGDLVDVAGDGSSWTGYVADVSGHGVSAGLLMAMFKTAVRTRASQTSPECLLNDVHRALYPLKTPNMFATVGVLQLSQGNQFSLALAGHPPLLHFSKRTGEVGEYPTLDLPLGILPEQTFSSTTVMCEPGDILLLLTDGMTEVFDKHGNEMGMEPIKSALAKSATLPLAEIFAKLRQVALGAGPQDDDQTMLIVRRKS